MRYIVEQGQTTGSRQNTVLSGFSCARRLTRLISVPTAQEGADPVRQMGEIVINILSDGSIKIEGTTVDLPQLLEKLASIAEQYENQPVRIRGDGGGLEITHEVSIPSGGFAEGAGDFAEGAGRFDEGARRFDEGAGRSAEGAGRLR